MPSPFPFSDGGRQPAASASPAVRPDPARGARLAETALILLGLALLASPFAIHALVLGAPAAFIATGIVLAGAAAGLVLARNGHFEPASAGLAGALLAGGAAIALADPAPFDPGLALMGLGPLLAALVSGRRLFLAAGAAFLALIVPSLWLADWAGSAPASLGAGAVLLLVGAGLAVARAALGNGPAGAAEERAQLAAYRHLVDHMRDGVIRFAPGGEVAFVSAPVEALLGAKGYEIAGAGLLERIHVADRPLFLTGFASASRDARPRTVSVRVRRDEPRAKAAAPRFFWAEIGFSPVPGSDGPGTRREVVALISDITEHKDREAAMQAARKAAETASEAKSRFLATMGHELRTPLNAVVGFSDMMLQGIGGELGETHRDYAGLIHQSGRHLLDVVGMLLDMSRLEAGKFEIAAEPFEPEALVAPSLRIVEVMARDKKVRLETFVARALPLLVADERACRQILINLLSNAIKFSHAGGTVAVSLKRQGQNLNISVSDSGIGMEPGVVERLGEPFFQARDGLDRPHEGTGLGLSIVKGLVELHGGTLRAISESGMGTTMTVLLPINGPSTRLGETEPVTELFTEPRQAVPDARRPWLDEKRKAL